MASPFQAENGVHSPSALRGSKGFEIGMLMGVRWGKGSPGLKVACRTGPGTVSCGSLSESLSATILSMESRLTGMSISMVVHHVFIWPIHDFSGTPFKVLHRVLHGVGLHLLSSPLFVPKRELFLSVIEKCCRRCCWTAQVAQISWMPNKHVDSGMSISFENCRMLKKSGTKQTFRKRQQIVRNLSVVAIAKYHKTTINRAITYLGNLPQCPLPWSRLTTKHMSRVALMLKTI